MIEHHQMEIRMLDNARVYVTCTCILRAIRSLARNKRARVKRTGREYGSLGDFPVGTKTDVLLTAFDQHLEEVNHG